MSRCYPFPPPGYIKSAPVELELSPKKEKRKHKDKKKKRKKHSATNGDLTIREDDQQSKNIEQPRQPNEGINLGIERLPSTTIQRLQTESSGDEAFSNCVLATSLESGEQRFKSREELPSRSMVAAERLQADNSRVNMLPNGIIGTGIFQRVQGVKSTKEGHTNGGLANGDVNFRFDYSSKVLSNGSSGCKRPQQTENSVYSNGVLSTKRKRLQADISGDRLLPKSVLSADCNGSNGLQASRSKSDVFMPATNSTTLQSDNSGKTLISKNGQPTDSERFEQRSLADNSRIKMATDGACSTISQADNGRAREVPYHLLANDSVRQGDKSKAEGRSNGIMASNSGKLQANGSSDRPPINGILTTKYDGPNKGLQLGKKVLLNNVRDSSTSISPANSLNETVLSGSLTFNSCKRSDQRLQGTNKVLLNGMSSAELVQLEADSTTGARANGVLAGRLEELNQPIKVSNYPSSPLRSAPPAPKSATTSSKISLDFEDKSIKEMLLKIRIPHAEQLWVTAEDEDWLTSCKQHLQAKQTEKVEDWIPQVWAEAVVLQAVGVNALPYVIPY